ncbi:MAG: succinylglutamate desuccinylase [Rhodospirillales bacterium]
MTGAAGPGGEAANQQQQPVEIAAPDIEAYRAGNTGCSYVTSFDGGVPGPHVMVAALVHGNELCGAHALAFLFERSIRPRRGRLSLGFCNTDAFLRFDAANPSASRYVDEDFNRVWDPPVLDGSRTSAELRRARELRPFVDTVDLLLDVHSMQTATRPLMLAGPLDKGAGLARQVAAPELVVVDEGHRAGRRLRDYGGFGDPASPRNALLVECGQHWLKPTVEVAIDTVLRFLIATGTVEAAEVARHRALGLPPPQRVIRVTDAVTVETSDFAFAANYVGLEVIPAAGTLIARDGAREIRTPYDECVLIMPSKRLGPGLTAVRLGRFVA